MSLRPQLHSTDLSSPLPEVTSEVLLLTHYIHTRIASLVNSATRYLLALSFLFAFATCFAGYQRGASGHADDVRAFAAVRCAPQPRQPCYRCVRRLRRPPGGVEQYVGMPVFPLFWLDVCRPDPHARM